MHILKQQRLEATCVNSLVQSEEDVNIPVLLKNMQILKGISVIKHREYQRWIQYFAPVWFVMLW